MNYAEAQELRMEIEELEAALDRANEKAKELRATLCTLHAEKTVPKNPVFVPKMEDLSFDGEAFVVALPDGTQARMHAKAVEEVIAIH